MSAPWLDCGADTCSIRVGAVQLNELVRLEAVRVRRGAVRPREVLHGVSLEINTGDRVVLLGPNGAGKTTLIGVATGDLKPSSGRVLSAAPHKGDPPRVAALPQHSNRLARLRVIEQVAYFAWLRGRPREGGLERARQALEAVGLDHLERRRVDQLSGGELRRVGLAGCLATGSQLLMLDEPTAGLDPAERKRFRDILKSVDTAAIVVTTHETHDVADLFTRVVVLVEGQILFDGAPTELVAQFAVGRSLEDAYLECVRERAAL